MPKTSYKVTTSEFEGPLDLLLDLVTKRKLFISDVSLASVTDDFIKYLEKHENYPIGESADFLVVASTLMLVKSRSLLPNIELSVEEEESISDLEMRLDEYARFKELAKGLGEIFGRNVIFEKEPSKNLHVVFAPDNNINISDLSTSLSMVLKSLPKTEQIAKTTIRKIVSLEDTIETLANRMTNATKMGFKDFYSKELGAEGELTQEKKVSIIVGFLAMLELVKRGFLRVNQETKGEIEMESGIEQEGV